MNKSVMIFFVLFCLNSCNWQKYNWNTSKITEDQQVVITRGGAGTIDIAFGGGFFAIANQYSKSIILIHSKALNDPLSIPIPGTGPRAIAFGNGVFAVASTDSNNVTIINPHFPYNPVNIDISDIADSPVDIAFGNDFFAVVNYTSNNVVLINSKDYNDIINIDTAKVGARIPVRIEFGGGFFGVLNIGSDSITLIGPDRSCKDVSIPQEINYSNGWDEYFGPDEIAFHDRFFAVVSSFCKNIALIDPHDLNNIIQITLDAPASNVAIGKEFLVATQNDKIVLVPLKNLRSQTEISTNGMVMNVVFGNNFLAFTNYYQGLTLLDLNNPNERINFDFKRTIYNIENLIFGDKFFAATDSGGNILFVRE